MPIAEVLESELPPSGTVLEIASGTGEHAVFFAGRFPGLVWQPSDADPTALDSIGEWSRESGLANLLPPLAIDASTLDWPQVDVSAILCINMAHISPWSATEGLFAGAARLLAAGAPLILYGPYREAGVVTAPSNEAFDASLKARDARWGLRQVEEVDRLAADHGLARTARHSMPANNLVLVYRKVPPR